MARLHLINRFMRIHKITVYTVKASFTINEEIFIPADFQHFRKIEKWGCYPLDPLDSILDSYIG